MPGRATRLAFSVALLLFAQGAARAAPLNWEGTFSIELLAGNPSFQAEAGGIASVNVSGGGLPAHLATLRLPVSHQKEIAITATGLVTDPSTPAPLFVTASLDPRTFSAISGGAASTGSLGGRVLPLRGVVKFGSLVPSIVSASDTAPLTWPTVNGATAGVGVGGGYFSQLDYTCSCYISWTWHITPSATGGSGTTLTAFGSRRVSVLGAPWTIKTARANGVNPPMYDWGTGVPPPPIVRATRRGFAHGPFSATTSTAQPGGMLQMVTPMQVRVEQRQPSRSWCESDLHHGWAAGGFGVLTLRFIPEPGVGLLLATGIAGLVAIGRQRIRK